MNRVNFQSVLRSAVITATLMGSLLFSNSSLAQIAMVGTAQTTTGSGTSLVVTKPTGVALGDVLFANVLMADNDGNTLTDPTPSGWIKIDGRDIASNGSDHWHATLFYKIAVAGDVTATNYTFTLDSDTSNDGSLATISAFRGADINGGFNEAGVANSGPFDVDPGSISTTNATSNTTTITAASITTATANAGVLMFAMIGNDVTYSGWQTATGPLPLTELSEAPSTAGNLDASLGLAGAVKTVAGSTGNGTVTIASSRGGAILIALKAFAGTMPAGTITGSPFCAGNAVSVPYTITGTYISGNVFTAQLSDASGSFAAPINIGTLTSTAAGTISATIPGGQASGTGYKIRVVSSYPAATGAQSASTLTINAAATAVAGTAITTCSNSGAVNITAGSSASNNSGITWSTTTGGTFTNANSLTLATYNPSPTDLSAGTVTLTLTATGIAPCGNVTSTKTITISPEATVDAGSPQTVCSNGSITLAGTRGGGATSSTWTAPSGTFSNASSLTSTYTPTIGSGTITLTLTTNDPTGPCGAVSDTVIITVDPAATVGAGGDQAVCSTSPVVTLTGTRGGGATSSLWTAPSGTFSDATSLTSTYTPSIGSGTVTLTLTTNDPTGPCGAVSDTMVVTVNAAATVDAGSAQAVCSNGSIALAGTRGGGATSSTWTAPSGTFSNASSLTSTYTPTIGSGTVTLTLTTNDPTGPCPAVSDTVIITVDPAATVNAGANQTVCSSSPVVTLAGTRSGGATSSLWTAPSGTFSDATSLTSTYTPSIASGTVTLTLTTNDPTGPCGAVNDTMTVTVNAAATVNAGSPQTVCSTGSITLAGTRGGGATSSTWTAPSGTFSNASSLTSTYTPAIGSGTVTLTLTSNDPSGPCPAVSDTVIITVNPGATINAGANQSVCAGESITLAGTFGGGASSATWTAPSGTFSDASSPTSTYTPSIASGTVILTFTSDDPSGPCPVVSSTMTVTVRPVPLTNGAVICVGETGSLTSTTTCTDINDTQTASGSGGTSDSITYGGSGNTNISIAFPSLPAGAVVTSTAVAITYTAVNLVSTRSDLRVRVTPPASVGAQQSDIQPSALNSSGTVTNAPLGTWGTGNPAGNWLFEFREITNDLLFGFIPATDANITNITINVGYSIAGVLNWYTASFGGTAIGSGSPFNPVGVLNSGLADTQAPGTTTFYAECSTVPGCRTATNFVINALPTVSFTTLASYYCESAAAVNLLANQSGGTFSGAGITNTGSGTATFNPATAGVGTHIISYSYTNGNGCTNSTTQSVDVNGNVNYYADTDLDGFGDLAALQVSCIGTPPGYVSNSSDCNDNLQTYVDADGDGFGINTFSPCSGITNTLDCNDALLTYVDADGDGFGINTFSACSGITNTDDCHDSLLTYVDADGDGFGSNIFSACSGILNALDCNDGLLTYIDADGDTYGSTTLSPCGVTDNTDCNDGNDTMHESFAFYLDSDNDGYGTGSLTSVCAVDAVTPPAGYSVNDTDCSPADSSMHTTYPFYADTDGDTYGSGSVQNLCAVDAVTPPAGYSINDTDCNPSNPALYNTYSFYVDADGDSYGTGSPTSVCANNAFTPPTNYSLNNTDCDDTKASVHPGASEIGYNLIDDDCDGLIDEGFPPKVTTVILCNYALDTIDTYVYANNVSGAQGYRWRVTTMNGPTAGQVQFIDTPLRAFRITQLGTYAFNTTYKVEVGVYYAGYLQPYTPTNCTVSTPAATTQLTSCGNTAILNAMNDAVYANNVPFAAGYKFKITDPSNPLHTEELIRPTREFRMNLITAFHVEYNKSYTVQTAVKNTDGTYLPYGPTCNFTTPVFPTTSLQSSQCDGYNVPNMSTFIFADSYPGAIGYVFKINGPGLAPSGVEVVRQLRSIRLSDFPPLVSGGIYNVRVRLIFNNTDPDGSYGKTCSIVTPPSEKIDSAGIKNVFSVVAYPNPFADNFNIDVTTANTVKVNMKVYDMTGRLLEVKDVEVSEMKTLQTGANYPSGVYNVIVSQGEEVKTLRVIKR